MEIRWGPQARPLAPIVKTPTSAPVPDWLENCVAFLVIFPQNCKNFGPAKAVGLNVWGLQVTHGTCLPGNWGVLPPFLMIYLYLMICCKLQLCIVPLAHVRNCSSMCMMSISQLQSWSRRYCQPGEICTGWPPLKHKYRYDVHVSV